MRDENTFAFSVGRWSRLVPKMATLDRNRGGYRIFLGDLGSRIGKHEIEKEFNEFGQMVDVWVAR